MFFDIGANIGNWSLSNINMCQQIIAVEASPNTYSKLIENTKNESKIMCLNYAVCNSDEKFINFYESNTYTISTLKKDWLVSENSRFYNLSDYKVITCETIKIDELIKEYGIPDLIKIDVEGGEDLCLSSLTQKINNICFEWASETNDITFKCLDHLEMLGYKEFAFQLEDDYTYRPENYESLVIIKDKLHKTTPKIGWGMIWAK
jgi:FkbM family methyltransferase